MSKKPGKSREPSAIPGNADTMVKELESAINQPNDSGIKNKRRSVIKKDSKQELGTNDIVECRDTRMKRPDTSNLTIINGNVDIKHAIELTSEH